MLDSSEDKKEDELIVDSKEEEEDNKCSFKDATKPWESGLQWTHYMSLVMERAKGRRKGMRIRELEDEVKRLKQSLQSVGPAPKKLLDLRVTHNSVKDELERMKLKNVAYQQDISELKTVESGDVANLKLQY